MRRGMLLMLELLLLLNAFLYAYKRYWIFREKEIETITELEKAERLFYLAKNAEIGFLFCLASENPKRCIVEWKNYWEKRGKVTFGYYNELSGECVQTSMNFEDFLDLTVEEGGGRNYFKDFGFGKRACIFVDLEIDKFKTSATLVSQLCASSQAFWRC